MSIRPRITRRPTLNGGGVSVFASMRLLQLPVEYCGHSIRGPSNSSPDFLVTDEKDDGAILEVVLDPVSLKASWTPLRIKCVQLGFPEFLLTKIGKSERDLFVAGIDQKEYGLAGDRAAL